MNVFLVSYNPLVKYELGQEAIKQHNIEPFVDYSCRREPDFVAQYPSITALCRKGKFAPRLKETDIVVYITTKGNYLKSAQNHWRLVAILKVFKRFNSHEEGAEWYRAQNITLPTNCMVDENLSKPLEMCAPIMRGQKNLRWWDDQYKKRSKQYGDFLVCTPLFLELYEPPIITETMMLEVFCRIPGTQNPPKISFEQFQNLKQICEIEI